MNNSIFPTISLYLRSYLLIAPFLLVLTIVNYFLRLILAAGFKFSKSTQLATGLDSLFHLIPSSGIVVVALVLDQHSVSDLERERKLFQKHILDKDGGKSYAKFKMVWRKICGYGCWTKASNFNLADHVVPSLRLDLDDDKPSWEWLLLDHVEISGAIKSIRILRFHHSLMDGISVGILFRDTFQFETNQSIFVVDPFAPLTFKARMTKALQNCLIPLKLPLHICKEMSTVPKEGDLDPLQMPEEQKQVYFAYSKSSNSSLFRKIKSQPGFRGWSTGKIINHAITSTLSRTILTGNVLRISATAAIPPISDAKPVPKNDFVVLVAQLDLKTGAEQLGSLNIHPENVFLLYYFQNWVASLPLWLSGQFLLSTTSVAETSYITNVPFTKAKGKLWGQTVEEILPFIALYPTMGIAFAATTYGNQFRMSGSADERFVGKRENLEKLLDAMMETIQKFAMQQ